MSEAESGRVHWTTCEHADGPSHEGMCLVYRRDLAGQKLDGSQTTPARVRSAEPGSQ